MDADEQAHASTPVINRIKDIRYTEILPRPRTSRLTVALLLSFSLLLLVDLNI